MPNGIDNFVNSIPSEYRKPTLSLELSELKPELLKAKDACEVGALTVEILGDIFETEFE